MNSIQHESLRLFATLLMFCFCNEAFLGPTYLFSKNFHEDVWFFVSYIPRTRLKCDTVRDVKSGSYVKLYLTHFLSFFFVTVTPRKNCFFLRHHRDEDYFPLQNMRIRTAVSTYMLGFEPTSLDSTDI